jgi:uncharacterized protein (DUF1800 family)
MTRTLLLGLAFGLSSLLSAQESRLSNLAVRAQGGGGDTLITGFTVSAGANKTVLVRAVGPTLEEFGVGGALADPRLELYAGETKIAENDNWNAHDDAAFVAVGAFPLGASSKDAALVATLAPGGYTAQVSGTGGGVTLVEVYEISDTGSRLINLSTRARVGTGGSILIPGITVSAGAGSRRLLLRAVGPELAGFGVDGALADPKLELLSGSSVIAENDNWSTAAGPAAASAGTLRDAFAQAGAFALAADGRDSALLVNLPAGSYTLKVSGVADTTGTALVEVYDLTPVNQTGLRPSAALYVAQLRPDAAAVGSTASGYATVVVDAGGNATVTVRFSNLTSVQTAARLTLGPGGDYVLNLPRAQVNGVPWNFAPSGAYTTNDLVSALNSGNIFVALDSAKFPGGELRGNFVPARGSQSFQPPPAPPALPASALTAPSRTDAARLLQQATFGPTEADLAAVMTRGITGWIDEQMARPASLHLAGLRADTTLFPNPPVPVPTLFYFARHDSNRVAAWWKIVLTGPDQLRQRVALALSEILVVTINARELPAQAEALACYYDLLVKGAFGNYRQLLEQVTLSPAMGITLSHRGNAKADPVTGAAPDKNFAREIQQLFTIGLVQLQPDGTLLLDAAGQPIPTYDQTTIVETAKVFTGWAFANDRVPVTTTNLSNFRFHPLDTSARGASDTSGWINPMAYYDAFHDKTEKRVVSLQQLPLAEAKPTIIPAGQTGPQDLKQMLDTLFLHPNTGPFLCRQLIQRLVTSNPSPGYVHRVARVFASDGTGTRGNLGAVVRAILTDYEARAPEVIGNAGYGKLKEPLLRLAGLLRSLNFSAPNGRFMDSFFNINSTWVPSGGIWGTNLSSVLAQGPLMSPTVFNFFTPDYSPPGALAAAGLVAPELQIINESTAISAANYLLQFFQRDVALRPQPPSGPSPYLVPDYTAWLPLAANIPELVDRLNLYFCANQMADATRTRIISLLRTLNPATTPTEIVRSALYWTVLCPDAAMQK